MSETITRLQKTWFEKIFKQLDRLEAKYRQSAKDN